MPNADLRCPHCRAILWDRAPRLRQVYDLLLARRRLRSRDVVEVIGISVQNANNALRRLAALGLAHAGPAESAPTGGIEVTYHALVAPAPERTLNLAHRIARLPALEEMANNEADFLRSVAGALPTHKEGQRLASLLRGLADSIPPAPSPAPAVEPTTPTRA